MSTVSPRTPELPMAFTAWEFLRGALLAYALFLSMTVSVWMTWVWMPGFVVIVLFFAAPVALLTLVLVGAPLALLAGLLMRRVRSMWLHLGAQGLVGGVAGVTGVLLGLSLTEGGAWSAPHPPHLAALDSMWSVALLQAGITIPAVLAAWILTSQLAFHADRSALRTAVAT